MIVLPSDFKTRLSVFGENNPHTITKLSLLFFVSLTVFLVYITFISPSDSSITINFSNDTLTLYVKPILQVLTGLLIISLLSMLKKYRDRDYN